ncbi:7tm 6 domain containing protein, partial [Asbolus verrucosus]
KIVKESKLFLLSVFINDLLLAVMIYFYFPIDGYNDNIYYAKYLFERIVPKYSAYLCYIYYATFPFLEYMMMFNPILLLYNTTQLKFQTRQNIYLPRIGSSLMFASATTLFAIVAGQLLTNESPKILESAANSRWTSWSQANRRSLLIFMINAQKPFVIGAAFYLCEYPFIITVTE